MLVLTRKTQQRIQIGSQITITILQVKGQAVRVGIEAPRDVCVLRSELASKLAAEAALETGEMADLPASPVKSRSRTALPDAMNPRDEMTMLAAAASSGLRCRAPGVKASPLAHHLERSGAASLMTSSPSVDLSIQAMLTR
jgi:carbon storage regulator